MRLPLKSLFFLLLFSSKEREGDKKKRNRRKKKGRPYHHNNFFFLSLSSSSSASPLSRPPPPNHLRPITSAQVSHCRIDRASKAAPWRGGEGERRGREKSEQKRKKSIERFEVWLAMGGSFSSFLRWPFPRVALPPPMHSPFSLHLC